MPPLKQMEEEIDLKLGVKMVLNGSSLPGDKEQREQLGASLRL